MPPEPHGPEEVLARPRSLKRMRRPCGERGSDSNEEQEKMSEHLDAIGIGREYRKEEKPCEVCDGKEFLLLQMHGRIAEAGVYGEMPVHACRRCGFTMQNPRYEDAFYRDYYQKLYREVAFGKTAPDQADIDEQVFRARGVMEYIHRFVRPPGRMLDHGCAAGGTMLPFKEAGWEVSGVDPHRPSVETGCEFLGLDIRIGAGEDLPFKDDSFELLFSLGSTEHAYDFGKMMEEARRVLVRNGWMLIRWRSENLWGSPLEYYNHNHYRFFTPRTWKLALRRYGFSVVDDTDVEYEHKPGEVYIMARSDLEPSLQAVHEAVAKGEGEDAEALEKALVAYRGHFARRCRKFLDYCEKSNHDVAGIARAARAGELEYRILLGDDAWAVKRARMEAERYLREFDAGRVI
jgi:SAM-dependent methyltransferase